MVAAGAAVVLPALDAVLAAQGTRLFGGVGEHRQHAGVLAAGGTVAGLGGGVQEGLEDGRVLGTVGAVAELAGGFGGADGGDGPDPMVSAGGGQRIAAGGADAEQTDPVGIDLLAGGEVGDGGLEVLDALGGVLQPAGQAAGLALVGGVEGEGDESALGHQSRVGAGGLFLHAGSGVADHQRRSGAGGGVKQEWAGR